MKRGEHARESRLRAFSHGLLECISRGLKCLHLVGWMKLGKTRRKTPPIERVAGQSPPDGVVGGWVVRFRYFVGSLLGGCSVFRFVYIDLMVTSHDMVEQMRLVCG